MGGDFYGRFGQVHELDFTFYAMVAGLLLALIVNVVLVVRDWDKP